MKIVHKIWVFALLGAGLFFLAGCACCGRTASVPQAENPEILAPENM